MVRTEYPRPQFQRTEWMNLNGQWEFEFDDERAGLREQWQHGGRNFSKKIQVPYGFESKLSGIGDPAAHDVVWYQRDFQLSDAYRNKRVLIHFGAVDYTAIVWVNGMKVGEHEGGHTSFSFDVTEALQEGDNKLVVRAEDYARDLAVPRGKQYWKDQSETIFYTRTTGIWQTVWLEPVSEIYIERVKLTPDIDANTCSLRVFVSGLELVSGKVELKVTAIFKSAVEAESTFAIGKSVSSHIISLNDFNYHDSRWNRWWSPEHPHLYDLQLVLTVDGKEVDRVDSYFGMRKISIEKGKVCLNNHPYYMKLVLDQGYFPDGLLTAPSDDSIRQDVELTKAMGFNGARKHQKIEDPRYLYWCDKLGLLVWGETANAYEMHENYVLRFTSEWQAAVERDYNHPCIIAWVPLNESWGVPNILHDKREQQHALAMYHLTKSLDPTRFVISNDGWEHMKSDLLTIHDYEWREDKLNERYSDLESALQARPADRQLHVGGIKYEGEPIVVSEFGGISFKKSDWEGWGYSGANSDEDFLSRLAAVIRPMLQSPVVQGFCYTQLTDVEQEINGLLTYDRKPKVPLEQIKRIMDGLS
ncbi:glycoside hydrolase family 2 protein [Paenibacillus agaridevorans]|uniref:glycoside hydrolase family 2 protein n=1 Tax=Paenibacillus agaridevorans TaxID=171404 RepID=UPI001FEBB503|nr:sugar-binding domain-containing protein [Paenibacillus agaridevorans]